MPFGDYADFADCVAKNGDRESPEGFCAWLHFQMMSQWPAEVKSKARSGAIERRAVAAIEFRQGEGGKVLAGYAAVFDELSDPIYGFRERIARTAFDKTLADGADVRALFNHNPDHVLGRTKSGTLRLKVDARGLAFEIDIPNTTAGNDLRELVRRGDIGGVSFQFYAIRDSWGTDGEGTVRTLEEVRLVDISPATFPAYPQSDVALRSIFGRAGIDWNRLTGAVAAQRRGQPLGPTELSTVRQTVECLRSLLPSAPPGAGHPEGIAAQDDGMRLRRMKLELESIGG